MRSWPKKFESVTISREYFSNIEDTKPYVENYVGQGPFVYMTADPQQGGSVFPMYYLKNQNLIAFSDSKDLAKMFVDELLRHDFRVASVTPTELSK